MLKASGWCLVGDLHPPIRKKGIFVDSCYDIIRRHVHESRYGRPPKGEKPLVDYLTAVLLESKSDHSVMPFSLWRSIKRGKPRITALLMQLIDEDYLAATWEGGFKLCEHRCYAYQFLPLILGYLQRGFSLEVLDRLFDPEPEAMPIWYAEYQKDRTKRKAECYRIIKSYATYYHRCILEGDREQDVAPLTAATSYINAASAIILRIFQSAYTTTDMTFEYVDSCWLYGRELLTQRDLTADQVFHPRPAEKVRYAPPGPLLKARDCLQRHLAPSAYDTFAIIDIMPQLEQLAYLATRFNMKMPVIDARDVAFQPYQALYYLPYTIWPTPDVKAGDSNYNEVANECLWCATCLIDWLKIAARTPQTQHAIRMYVLALVEASLEHYQYYLIGWGATLKADTFYAPRLANLVKTLKAGELGLGFDVLATTLEKALSEVDGHLQDFTAPGDVAEYDSFKKAITELQQAVRDIGIDITRYYREVPEALLEPSQAEERVRSGSGGSSDSSGTVFFEDSDGLRRRGKVADSVSAGL